MARQKVLKDRAIVSRNGRSHVHGNHSDIRATVHSQGKFAPRPVSTWPENLGPRNFEIRSMVGFICVLVRACV